MRKSIRQRAFVLGGIFLVALGFSYAIAFAQESAAQRPNVIVIITDDQGFGDMGRAGELDCHDASADPAACQHPLETALQAAALDSFTPNIDLRLNRSTQHCHLVLLLGNGRPTSFAASG